MTGRRRWALAASLAGASVIAALLIFQFSRAPLYTTSIGEQRTVTLSDGSRMEMNSRTRLRVQFTEQERTIDLLEGQAFFQVAKNPQRPFVVKSADIKVRAVGTQFDVYRKEGGTVVTVVEGRVAVVTHTSDGDVGAGPPIGEISTRPGAYAEAARAGRGRSPSVSDDINYLSAGEQLTVTPESVTHSEHTDIAAATAWTHGSLIFSGSRLADVVQEFNRYNHRQLVVRGLSLADTRISGVYSSTDPALLVRFLREQPGVQVDDSGPAIVISAR